jgi:hypothetical protein
MASGAARIVAVLLLSAVIGCGLDSDGSHKASTSGTQGLGEGATTVGRFQTESVRLGMSRPTFLLIDTATGDVLQRPVRSSQMFEPVTDEPPPGANFNPKVPGRFSVKVVPGGRGSALLRLDTATGDTWFYQLGSKQTTWQALPSALEVSAQANSGSAVPAAGGTNSRDANRPVSSQVGAQKPQVRRPSVASMVEVLTEPGLDPELRIWTAGFMAETYPTEAVELITTKLRDADSKLHLTIVEKVQLDSEGRVRRALQKVSGHDDPAVAAALAKKLTP